MILNFAKIFVLIGVLCISTVFNLFSQNSSYNYNDADSFGEEIAWFAKWYDDKNSAFSFSFDDGFISQYENVRPILNQFNFKGTFYVMPPFLTDSLPGIWRYGTWTMFSTMSFEGHEIGSHTMNHLHLTQLEAGDTLQEGTILYEIYQSKKAINQRLPDKKCITMAYPYAEHNYLVDSLTALFYESARAIGLVPNGSSFPDSLWYKLNAINVIFSGPRTSLEDDMEELQTLQSWIESSISENAWGILQAHEVVPQDSLVGLIAAGAYEPYSNEWFTLLCDRVNSKSLLNDLWVETISNVTRYIKERDNAFYKILSQNEFQIKLLVDDDLDDEIYDFPISAYIKVPDSWEFALVTQDDYVDTLEVFINDSGYVVLTDVIPNSTIITLDKFNPTGIYNSTSLVSEFKLLQNYPNPFNPVTTILYSVAERGNIKLIVYDILGNRIKVIVDEEKTAGVYSVLFNSENLSSGVYFYTLQYGSKIETRKMVITK